MFPSVIYSVALLCSVLAFTPYKTSRSVDARQFDLRSPCPGTFQYQNDQNGNLIGLIQVNAVDGRLQIDVELSVGNAVQGYNGKITLAESREQVIQNIMYRRPILYRVHFPPWQGIPPKLTRILVNGNLICSGPRIPIQLVPVLTTINLQHKLSLGVTPLISSSDPSVDLFDGTIYNNLVPNFGGNQQNTEDPQEYAFDIRGEDRPINVFPDNNKNNRIPTTVNNPYNFNPQPVQSSSRPAQQFPQNPFFSGVTTTKPSFNQNIPANNNQFFNPRTSESPVVIPQTTKAPNVPIRGSQEGTINYNQICGRPLTVNTLIYNGQSVPKGAYPWLVAIFRTDSFSLSYICSGSLISTRHVLTAAHCVKYETRRLRPTELVCILGRLNIRKWVSYPGEKMLEPESIIVHPNYEAESANADIALVVFADPIQFNKIVRPVCLWTGSSDLNLVVGQIGTVAGWGRDENGEVSTAEPRQVSLPIVSQEQCLRSDRDSGNAGAFVQITSDKTFCAGFRNGSGPCNGDSGSGFLLRRNGVYYLRGIVSVALSESSQRTCDLSQYVVFTDASKYLNWILSYIK